jgi:hypothetical protein
MSSILNWLYCKALGWLQRKCEHPPEVVSADIADGDFGEDISWCRLCGATMIRGSVHEPRADWWIKERAQVKARERSSE